MQTNTLLNQNDLPALNIKATIILGLLSQKCKGKGICSITIDGPEEKSRPSNVVNAIISFDQACKQLTIQFIKSSMKACTKKAYFNSGFFEVKEPFKFTDEILDKLGLEQYHIAPDQYKISDLDNYYTIHIK